MGYVLFNDVLYRLFKLDAVNGHISAAACAHYAYIAADTEHLEKLFTAGVRLFQLKNVANAEFNDLHTFTNLSDKIIQHIL